MTGSGRATSARRRVWWWKLRVGAVNSIGPGCSPMRHLPDVAGKITVGVRFLAANPATAAGRSDGAGCGVASAPTGDQRAICPERHAARGSGAGDQVSELMEHLNFPR